LLTGISTDKERDDWKSIIRFTTTDIATLLLLGSTFLLSLGLLVSGPLAHTLFELVTKRFMGKEGAKWKVAQIMSTQLITSPIQNASKILFSFLSFSPLRSSVTNIFNQLD